MEVDEEDGDFEDLETGEKHEAKKEDEKTEGLTREELLAKKQKLKQQFDAEYDEQGDNKFHDDLKMQATQQAQVPHLPFI